MVLRGAVGLVSAQDPVLAAVPEGMHGSAQNSHFEDRLENGQLALEFKLEPGIVHSSNALKLRQSVPSLT